MSPGVRWRGGLGPDEGFATREGVGQSLRVQAWHPGEATQALMKWGVVEWGDSARCTLDLVEATGRGWWVQMV